MHICEHFLEKPKTTHLRILVDLFSWFFLAGVQEVERPVFFLSLIVPPSSVRFIVSYIFFNLMFEFYFSIIILVLSRCLKIIITLLSNQARKVLNTWLCGNLWPFFATRYKLNSLQILFYVVSMILFEARTLLYVKKEYTPDVVLLNKKSVNLSSFKKLKIKNMKRW